MGRREIPLESDGSPLVDLALWLRGLRDRAGLTYDEMSAKVGVHKSTLSRAASGTTFPDYRHVEAYARACGADVHEARGRWATAQRRIFQASRAGGGRVDFRAPRPDLVVDAAELREAMRLLYQQSGLSFRDVEQKSRELQTERGGGYAVARSTLYEVLAGRARPTRRVVMALVEACGVRNEELTVWESAWERVKRQEQRRDHLYGDDWAPYRAPDPENDRLPERWGPVDPDDVLRNY
ncbi:helix-turn-helix domain-containing protein [Actinosynnema sp. CS-041913]|uniref:helix-turn-helix domain-containing protein n=1 Tax=Actinosynnema sp. CS-041913 TaxID=3239917 RepID=UPI003D8EF931